jgi:putative nucleotide binding protein
VVGRITYEDLTATAKTELENVLDKLIRSQEPRFVNFFNNSSAITPRMHSLELLPGIGKKIMWLIIEQRETRPFVSLDDFKNRTGIAEPVKLLVKRIIEELSGSSKYRLFTRLT